MTDLARYPLDNIIYNKYSYEIPTLNSALGFLAVTCTSTNVCHFYFAKISCTITVIRVQLRGLKKGKLLKQQ